MVSTDWSGWIPESQSSTQDWAMWLSTREESRATFLDLRSQWTTYFTGVAKDGQPLWGSTPEGNPQC